ncbi:Protein N-acetyltransferase, RimJ/RimL family [Amycolatopsis xylanica]|uniref:Protein N-acetyltransferase, RimJ/RimL family n=1 Tax=Amycolatopsis xylanica TaxID=589385 RepID=A0A1H3JDX6_9PSEU|nr:GNAT family N-acetyltransferase [Amycolatopsis xylanica]SDY38220.1 Protein N-acetyltransferase, RimJ/RimL family [Amycolatopsis xylanica]
MKVPDEVRLSGENLVLREWTEADLPTMVTLFDDPAVARFTPLASPFDDQAAVAYLAKARRGRAEGKRLHLAITEDGGTALGEVLMFHGKDGDAPGLELGYSVGSAYRGRKLAARALRVLTAYARELGFDDLELTIEETNAGSQGVARAAGYHLTDSPPERVVEKGREATLYRWAHRA